MQSGLGYKPLWQPSRWKSCRDAGSAQAVSPVPGSPAGSCLKLFLQSVHLHMMASLGKDVFTKFSVQPHDLRLFLALLPLSPLNGPGPHSLFLWLKGRNCRLRTFSTSFSIPLKWRQGWHSRAGLNSFRLNPLILNLLRLHSWWRLVHVVGEVPRAGALGCLSLPLSPIPIHKSGQVYTLTEIAAAAVVGAILPRPVGRGGGRRCNQCCAKPVLPGHLLGVSSPVGWHGPGDYE